MNEFLDRILMGNTIRSYLIVVIVILVVIVIKRYLARSIALLIFQLVKNIWVDIEKKPFINLVARPLGFFLAVLTSVIALYKLNFPEEINVDIYHITVKELLHGVGSLAIIISFIRLLVRMIDFVAIILTSRADRMQGTANNQLIIFFKDFFKVILVIVGLLMILKFTFGYHISNLLTGLSIVGAAIALALRESLENLIASFIIFFDKPFHVGDLVKIQGNTGTVEKIGLRSTRIISDQKTMLTVPNKQMVDAILDNLSLRTQRKAELKLEIRLSTSSQTLQDFLAQLRKIVDRKEVGNSTVLLSDITSSAFHITVEYFTGPVTIEEFNSLKEEINLTVLKLVEQSGIEMAGAKTEVHISPEAGKQQFQPAR
jgi:MscS family membrane protein